MAVTQVKLEWSDGIIQAFTPADFYLRLGIMQGASGSVRIYFLDPSGNEGPPSEWASWLSFVPGQTFIITNPALVDSSDILTTKVAG